VPANAQKWIIPILFAGVLLGALDIAVVGPALPAIQKYFAIDSRSLSWVFSIYPLFYLVGAPLLAKLSDRQGRRSVYVASIGLFAVGSLIVALVPVFHVVLLGRAVQAFGAGGIFPVASAVIAETVPQERRGRVLGLIGAVFGLAFLLGPLLGGVLLPFGWQWLFLINVPIALGLIVAGSRTLPQTKAERPGAFDAFGAAVLSVGLAALVWAVSQLDTAHLTASVLSLKIWPIALIAIVAVPLFWRAENGAADPVLHPDLFRSVQLKLVGAIAFAAGLVEAGMVFLPNMAVTGLKVETHTASLMMLPLVLTLMVGAPLAGRLLDRTGARPVVQGGLALTVLGLALFAWLPLNLVSFYSAGAIVGFGLSGLLGAPLRYIMLQEAGETRRGAGQGLLTLFLNVGQVVGSAVIGGVAGSNIHWLGGYRHALLTVAAACSVALVLSAALRGKVGTGRKTARA
jgi:MFS family permease